MNIIKHYNNIYEIEDFLTKDEISTIMLSAAGDFTESHLGNITKDLNNESLALMPSISNRLMSFFDKAQSHTKITNIRRLQNNEYMPIHLDDGYPDEKYKIVYGVVIYLNDDFSGGFLNYPELKLSIKPKPGSLMIHESQILHEVLPVTNGSRYSLTSFILGDSDTKLKM